MSVKLICVKEYTGKLRIKFHSFINEENKEYFNVYDNTLNCRFPRKIREEGKMYIVPLENVQLSTNKGGYFYTVKSTNIKIVDLIEEIKKYIEPECVICMEKKQMMLYIPCGHVGVCIDCDVQLKNRKCPMCRSIITQEIKNAI